jgi:Ca2+/Na+ antiporter
MTLAFVALIAGLALLVWSADKFVDGAAATARYAGMPPLLIGMVIIGFGTSAPEMVVSALAASQGNPGLALGNAYGSNITNIALILGLTALIEAVAFQKLDSRLAATLLGHGSQLRATHQALADELGTVREIVTRLLHRFERSGWVELSRECITIRDSVALRQLAAQGSRP